MKVVSLKPYYGKLFLNNRVFKIADSPNIFLNLNKRLKKEGVLIDTIDIKQKQKIDKYVYCDVPYPWEFGLWFKIILNKEKNVLFCFESPLVNPFSHIKLFHWFFRKIYTWDDRLIGIENRKGNKKYYKFAIPQLDNGFNTKPKKYAKKEFAVLINSRKFAPIIFRLISPYKTDLYKERLRIIEFFEKHAPNKLTLYGRGWEKHQPKLTTYKGKVKNKLKTLSRFKYGLCFENTAAKGYITEKLFDCFKAKCVPVYLGASNVEKYIPKKCFIDARKFGNYNDLLNYLESLNEKKYNTYINNAQSFLKKPGVRDVWFREGFIKTLIWSTS